MDFLDWINRNRPGKTQDLPDRIEIAHESGEHSTLWKRSDNSDFARLRKLGTVYMQFDGLDLFSSTFKFASVLIPRVKNDVMVIFTLEQFESEVASVGCHFPELSVPFLYQAGIGYCAVDIASGRIYEYDAETGQSDEYESLEELLDEWLAAIV
jgi:hypothetical protein